LAERPGAHTRKVTLAIPLQITPALVWLDFLLFYAMIARTFAG
jgi:hypothetical protein